MFCDKHYKWYNLLCVECMVNKYSDTPIAMPGAGSSVSFTGGAGSEYSIKTLYDFDDILSSRDVVNKPEHYQGKVECIDAIESAVEGLEGIEAVCTANAIKYLYRWKKKNGVEDIKKAKWYIERLLNGLDAN